MRNDKKYGLIGVRADGNFIAQEDIDFGDAIVHKGFVWNGANVPDIVLPLLGKKKLYLGIYTSCIHDYKATYQDLYPRKQATKQLVNLWIRAGLPKWKGWLAYIFVELYCKYWRKWK